MNKIKKQLKKIKDEKRLGLMTHIVAGFPTLEESKDMVMQMEKSGVDFVEIQIPFSDPMADGPTIMQANKKSLDGGTKVRDAFTLMSELNKTVSIPLLFMGYFNTVYNYGIEKFTKDASDVGARGLIFPDYPIEHEAEDQFMKHARKNDLNLVRVLSPASTEDRLKINKNFADGFVYYVGRKGITGAKEGLDPGLAVNLKEVRKYIDLPIAVGFGISKPEHIESLKDKADIAVIGSAVLNVYNKKGLSGVEKFLSEIVEAC